MPAGRLPGLTVTRRELLRLGAAASVVALVPATAAAAPSKKPDPSPLPDPLADPYGGGIALTFPLPAGTSKSVGDNWHSNREGEIYSWSHRNNTARAHDGVDLFPRSAKSLPPVYAPLTARVAAVNVAGGAYRENTRITLPWAYAHDAASIYGSYVWLLSTDPASVGFYVFYCHLKVDDTLRALQGRVGTVDDTVTTSTRVGTLGDTGNAAGQPQLHVELHYPADRSFTCTRCTAPKAGLTAFNPYPSLSRAVARA